MKSEKNKTAVCKWYSCCPVKRFTDQGRLDSHWIKNYCLKENKSCVRYQMEEKGKFHPDNMLPNGKTDQTLS